MLLTLAARPIQVNRLITVREFARARMQEIYDTFSDTVSQAQGTAPAHSRIHSGATKHLVHRFIGMFSTLSKLALKQGMSDDNVSDEHLADLQHKCRSIVCDLRTKRNGSPGAATEHALITQKICDICAAKHINIVFEQLEKETKELAAWAELKRQESSDHFKKVRDSSIMALTAP